MRGFTKSGKMKAEMRIKTNSRKPEGRSERESMGDNFLECKDESKGRNANQVLKSRRVESKRLTRPVSRCL